MATSHSKVSKALRFEILRRDNFRCHYCGTEAAQTELHVDHVVPQSLGGTNDPSNLVTACAQCNSGKAGRTLDEPVLAAVDEKAQHYATAVEQAIAERRQVLTTERQTKETFRAEWNSWQPAEPLPAGFGATVHQFMHAGLEWEDITDSIEIAMSRKNIYGPDFGRFKYFCGVCNRKIEDIRKRADEIMAGTESQAVQPRWHQAVHDAFTVRAEHEIVRLTELVEAAIREGLDEKHVCDALSRELAHPIHPSLARRCAVSGISYAMEETGVLHFDDADHFEQAVVDYCAKYGQQAPSSTMLRGFAFMGMSVDSARQVLKGIFERGVTESRINSDFNYYAFQQLEKEVSHAPDQEYQA